MPRVAGVDPGTVSFDLCVLQDGEPVIEQVFDKILELNKRTGLGVLLVEQNSAMALEIASRAFVLETGAITLSGPAETLARDPRIREAYLGGNIKESNAV